MSEQELDEMINILAKNDVNLVIEYRDSVIDTQGGVKPRDTDIIYCLLLDAKLYYSYDFAEYIAEMYPDSLITDYTAAKESYRLCMETACKLKAMIHRADLADLAHSSKTIKLTIYL